MIMLIVQTLILMAVAFGVGCLVGCWFKGRAGSGQQVQSESGNARTVHEDVAPAIAATVATPAVAESSGSPVARATEAAEASQANPTPSKGKASRGAPGKAKSSKSAPVKAKASNAAPSKAAIRKAPAKSPSVSRQATTKPAAREATSATAATAGPPTAQSPGAKSKAGPALKPKAPKAESGVADDLKKIKGIGPQNEVKLRAIGINSFAQIASWKKTEQAEIGERLAFAGRVEREDWVGQAKILAKGGETDFSRRTGKSNPTGTSAGSGKPGGKKRS